jgi:hypothetical protein
MKKSSFCMVVFATMLTSACVQAATVYDATNKSSSEAIWWPGLGKGQVQANVVGLAGTARMLDSVTLGQFWYGSSGTYNVTASIYAVPKTINDNDLLSNPLWTSTVTKTYINSTGMNLLDSVSFSGSNVRLPDQVVLCFSFDTADGSAAIPFRQYAPTGSPISMPAVGTLGTGVYYSGYTDLSGAIVSPAGWHNLLPDDNFLPYPMGKINASVPDPSAIIPLSFGLMGFIFAKRRVRR